MIREGGAMEREKEIEEMIRDYYRYDEFVPSDDLQEAIRKGGYINIVNLYDANYRKIPDGEVVLTREEYNGLRIDKGYMEFLKKQLGNLPVEYAILKKRDEEQADLFAKTMEAYQNALEEAKEQVRKETAMEICDFAEKEIKKLGKETTTDSFGERPLLFYEAAGKLVRSIREKFGGEE